MATGTECTYNFIQLTSMTSTSSSAPTGDDPLTSDDAVNVLEEILEAQNQSYVLGLKLKLPLHVVDAIHSTNPQPRHRLLQVLIEFTKQLDPRPTWRAIVDALRNPVINLPQLAMRVERAHFSDPTATRNEPPEPIVTIGKVKVGQDNLERGTIKMIYLWRIF